jgi:Bifunctional DNA primase/polymerase, N-terminal
MPTNQERPNNGPLRIHHPKDNTTMLEHGLTLAAADWEIFPCKWTGPAAKAPLTVNGHHDATTNPDKIKLWWGRWPKAMIGAKVPDSAIVIDIDPRNGGDLAELESLTGPLPTTLTVWSGRNDGGRHLYFLRPAGQLVSTKLPDGIDLKVNGYCILPPSIHPATGDPYRWEHHEIAGVPHALRELLRPTPRPVTVHRGSGGNGAGLINFVAQFKTDGVNNALYWASRRAAEEGILGAIADDLVETAVSVGESPRRARNTVASARKAAS